MHYILTFLAISCIGNQLFSQTKSDSTKTLTEITVKAYLSERRLISLPSTVTVIGKTQIDQTTTQSLVPVLNSVAGVKMEERSPGSYRLSIRGSLIRSPFGVRNIKVYYDDLPLTDAGGNTYLNLIDQSAIENIEILKGPDGSLFGANSGGVVLINTQANTNRISTNLLGGSYGLFKENVSISKKYQNFEYNVHQSYQRVDGYRDHSQMKRYFFQAAQKVKYNDKGSIKFSGFYSDLGYETPGGLNINQLNANPRQSRPEIPANPPRPRTPSAEEQNAGIYNRTLFGGIRHEYQFNDYWKHVFSVSGITTNFKNPFISNYEKRKENSLAIRTYLDYQNSTNPSLKYQWNLGWEFQESNATIRNFNNDKGSLTTIIAADQIKNDSQFIFSRLALGVGPKFNSEFSASLNFTKYSFGLLPESKSTSTAGNQTLKPQLMPKFALSYSLNNNLVLRGIISRGFSAPTTAEVRASDAKINTDLKAEKGWNYELGLRFRTPFERIYIDLAGFYYRLNDAIVRRVNANDQDFFVNAGGTNQKGIELQLNAQLLKTSNSIFNQINFASATTLNDFKFRDYKIATADYSDNLLTGVPKIGLSNSLNFDFKNHINFFVQHQFNGQTSLNDAETVFASSYNLIFTKLSWSKKIGQTNLNFNIGVDNLLNENYSLGNDLNAFGARYYNPSAKRNYFVGLGIKF